MAVEKFQVEKASPAPRRVIRGSPAPLIWNLEDRLATVERELRVQFTRIAQLQATLDLLLAASRHVSDGAHPQDAIAETGKVFVPAVAGATRAVSRAGRR